MDALVKEDVRPPRHGVTVPSRPPGGNAFLSDVVVELGFIDRATADRAVELGRVNGRAFHEILLESGMLNEGQLSLATAEIHGLEHVDLEEFDIDPDVAGLIAKSAARRYGAVPVAFDDDGTLLIALSDPFDPLAVDDIAVMTKSDVRPMVAAAGQIDAVIEDLHDAPPEPMESPVRSPSEPDPLTPSEPDSPTPSEPDPLEPDPPSLAVAPYAEEVDAAPGPFAVVPPSQDPTPPATSEPTVLSGPAPQTPDPAREEMAQMRETLAALAERVETLTTQASRSESHVEGNELAVSQEEHDEALGRLADAERRADEAAEAQRHADEAVAEAERRADEAAADAERRAGEAAADAERRAGEATDALDQLADVKRRASEAEEAVEQHREAERELRGQLESATEAIGRLQERLSSALAAATEIRSDCEKLVGSGRSG